MPQIKQPVRQWQTLDFPERTGIFSSLRPYRRGLLVLLIPAGMLMTSLASRYPEAVENIHSRGIYRALSAVFGRLFGLLPISVAEILLFLVVPGTLAWLIMHTVPMIKKSGGKKRLLGMFATIGCVCGVTYFIFTVFCGLNYHRLTFAEQSGLPVRPSSPVELASVYAELVKNANELAPLVNRNVNGVMVNAKPHREIARQAPAAMAVLAEQYPVLDGFTPNPKPVLMSRGMSAVNITGIFMPFTFEANVNVDVPDYNIPFTMLHELSHYKGFMREDEANFIAYLACRESDDPVYRYSGVMGALSYCGSALYGTDPELYKEIAAYLDDSVWTDYAANSAYWKRFEGPVAEVAGRVNDTYLRANSQVEGVRSYGRMVDLLLADYRKRHEP